jgi:hypothetical protein
MNRETLSQPPSRLGVFGLFLLLDERADESLADHHPPPSEPVATIYFSQWMNPRPLTGR